MSRSSRQQRALITNSVSTSEDIFMGRYAEGVVFFPSGWTACTIEVYGKNPVDGTWLRANGLFGPLNVPNAASGVYPLPDEVFAFDVIRLVASISGNNAIPVGVLLKD